VDTYTAAVDASECTSCGDEKTTDGATGATELAACIDTTVSTHALHMKMCCTKSSQIRWTIFPPNDPDAACVRSTARLPPNW
jgi:hypothetical protein